MKNTAAGKDERVRCTADENRQLDISIKRCCRYRLPVHFNRIGQLEVASFDIAQIFHAYSISGSQPRGPYASYDAVSGRRPFLDCNKRHV
jgi:hypothetical protein